MNRPYDRPGRTCLLPAGSCCCWDNLKKAAQEHLLKTVAAAREADGKASYTPLGSRQPPLRETMKAAKGVRLVPDHVLVAELLGNPRPPTTAPSPNRKPVSFETKTKSAPELVAASLSGS